MSLTKDDLQAIQSIVEKVTDDLRVDVAAGFAEVHEKFDRVDERLGSVEATVTRIENKLDATAEKVDGHEVRLGSLEKQTA